MRAFTVTVKAGLKKEQETQKRTEKELPQPPARIARQLALAYLVERLIDQGKIRNYAEASRRLSVTRARLSQIANLINLPSETQNAILLGQIRDTESQLRCLLADPMEAL